MGRLGGGTVYLPQGQYRVARLTVPTGVELRGPLGGDVHGSIFAVCSLLGYEGKNTGSPASAPALLTLSPRSGIRGFDIAYPEQGYGSAVAPVVPYPFTIRGTGAGVWVENVTVADAFNLIDFATFRCDDHFASGVEAAVLNTGVVAGGGSEHGRLERMLISRGLYAGQRLFGPPGPAAQQSLVEYMRQNTVPFAFGNCFQEMTFGLDSFDVKIGWRMLADGGGCTDSTFWQPSSDTTSRPAISSRAETTSGSLASRRQLVGDVFRQLRLFHGLGRCLRHDELGQCDQSRPFRRRLPFSQRKKSDSRKTGHGELVRVDR